MEIPMVKGDGDERQRTAGSSPKVRQVRMNPRVARGLPCLDGTQIPVTVFLELFKKGYTVDRIVTECYPELSREDVLFAVDFIIDWVRRAPGYLSDLVDRS
ncbi:MAG: DUF433 domain-containing protein [Nitrospirae bacterium]|nr:DUF433 domain-containing protein [Nitrospirota bacterium]MCL5284941.1 DUF433 domain-containing protein [Nitrospirota bacterium]